MKAFSFQVLGLFILIVVGLMISTNGSQSNPILRLFNSEDGNFENALVITDNTGQVTKAKISIEIAESQEAKARGLGGRQSLASNAGMLFVYDKPAKPRFWMKGMLIPLDFIWIRGNDVADLLPNIPPPGGGVSDTTLPLYSSTTEIDKILEVNAGFISAHNILVGDKIKY